MLYYIVSCWPLSKFGKGIVVIDTVYPGYLTCIECLAGRRTGVKKETKTFGDKEFTELPIPTEEN